MHAEDRMATEKLCRRYRWLCKSVSALEELLANRLAELEA